MNSLLRNAKYIFRKRGMMPVYLLLGATYRCNARCITCFNHNRLNNDEGKELTLAEHKRIAAGMGPITWLLFTGGEPVLRDDLPLLAEVYYVANNIERITVPTNALMPGRVEGAAKEILDRCQNANIAFSLAIDGVGSLHDEIRGVKGNFSALQETYARLVDVKRGNSRFSINLNTVLMNRNIESLDELTAFVLGNMPDTDFHGFEILRGAPPDESLKPPTADQYRVALDKLIPYWNRFPFYRGPLRKVLRAAKIESRLIELDVLRGRGSNMPCHAGSVSCVIDPNGDIYFCEEFAESIGNLRDVDYDFKRLWFSESAEKLRGFVARKGCRCTHSCFVGSSLMFEPRYYGRLLARMLSGRFRTA